MRTFTPVAEARLKGLHPKLVAVLRAAKQSSKWDFTIAQGVRTVEQAYVNFGKGRTGIQCLAGGCPAHYAQPNKPKVTFLHHALSSNHLPKADGFGYAADLLPEPYSYDPKYDSRYADLKVAMFAEAAKQGVHLVWGGDWKQTPDRPHFELHL